MEVPPWVLAGAFYPPPGIFYLMNQPHHDLNSLQKSKSTGCFVQTCASFHGSYPPNFYPSLPKIHSSTAKPQPELHNNQIPDKQSKFDKLRSKYSDADLKTDSSVPPVIRLRNKNRKKELAAVSCFNK